MKNTKVDKPSSEEVELNEGHKVEPTKVKVRSTLIKFYNEDTNKVEEIELVGKMSVAQCKVHLKSLNKDNLFINKVFKDDEFEVDTIALTQLKQA